MSVAEGSEPARRQVLKGTGVAIGGLVGAEALSGCTGGGESAVDTPGATGGDATIPVDKVPVGGGYVDSADEVVVTQPSKGTFKAFSAVCTHQGCLVNQVLDGRIRCPCHGSEYSITTGAVERGPAPKPLPKRQVTRKGTNLRVT